MYSNYSDREILDIAKWASESPERAVPHSLLRELAIRYERGLCVVNRLAAGELVKRYKRVLALNSSFDEDWEQSCV